MEEFEGFSMAREEQCLAYCRARLEPLRAERDGKLVEREGEGNLELRMKIDGTPARVIVGVSSGTIELELRSRNCTGTISVFWDDEFPTEVGGERTQVEPDDDWDDDDTTLRHPLGRGVVLEGTRADLDEMVPLFAGLPADVRADVIETSARMRLFRTLATAQGIDVMTEDTLDELPDGYLSEMLAYALRIGEAMSHGDRPIDEGDEPAADAAAAIAAAMPTIACAYCGATFMPTYVGALRCPNCGAVVGDG